MLIRSYAVIFLCLISPNLLASEPDATDKYRAPVTFDTIQDSNDPHQVAEALLNTIKQGLQSKEIADKKIHESKRIFTSLTCLQYASLKHRDGQSAQSQWRVVANWYSPKGISKAENITIKASTRDLAASFAMCDMWEKHHIPIDRFSGFNVSLLP